MFIQLFCLLHLFLKWGVVILLQDPPTVKSAEPFQFEITGANEVGLNMAKRVEYAVTSCGYRLFC